MNRLRAAALFLFAWLNTPSSKAGLVAIVGGLLSPWVAPEKVDAVVQLLMLGGGIGLVLWPQKKTEPPQ